MKKASVFASKKGPLGNTCGTPVSISGTSSSLFDSSLQQHNPVGSSRNWQGTPTSTRRLPPAFHQQLLQPSNSSASIRSHPMAPMSIASNTPNTSIINRAKPCTLPGLVENLNEVEPVNFSLFISLSLSLSEVTRRTCYTTYDALRNEVWLRRHSDRHRREHLCKLVTVTRRPRLPSTSPIHLVTRTTDFNPSLWLLNRTSQVGKSP